MMQGGDFVKGDGTGGESIYGGKFDDEAFIYPHDRAGLLSMANSGPNTNGSQFFITFKGAPHLDGKHVVFGHVHSGMDFLRQIEGLRTDNNNRPMKAVCIEDCGEIEVTDKDDSKKKKDSNRDRKHEDKKSRKRSRSPKRRRHRSSSSSSYSSSFSSSGSSRSSSYSGSYSSYSSSITSDSSASSVPRKHKRKESEKSRPKKEKARRSRSVEKFEEKLIPQEEPKTQEDVPKKPIEFTGIKTPGRVYKGRGLIRRQYRSPHGDETEPIQYDRFERPQFHRRDNYRPRRFDRPSSPHRDKYNRRRRYDNIEVYVPRSERNRSPDGRRSDRSERKRRSEDRPSRSSSRSPPRKSPARKPVEERRLSPGEEEKRE
ncbi:putative Peptidyl-prolyl cis-trans isomerase 1 [Blattamonas nauphoetae]|uniref:Peptidyl-prolyl cis-trans isomerase 1 n=1 Tax=Blattamonas nauphoetae TaxID=2049346 RepID=A0ABQ9XFW3_9EUKA|nr:putative Peptidyl-prolyl cis-trans isomerase 1 [Blattamonas nauphoetae]